MIYKTVIFKTICVIKRNWGNKYSPAETTGIFLEHRKHPQKGLDESIRCINKMMNLIN